MLFDLNLENIMDDENVIFFSGKITEFETEGYNILNQVKKNYLALNKNNSGKNFHISSISSKNKVYLFDTILERNTFLTFLVSELNKSIDNGNVEIENFKYTIFSGKDIQKFEELSLDQGEKDFIKDKIPYIKE